MSWPLVKLGELADILSGYAFKSSLFNTDNVGLPLIRIRDVVDGKSDTFYSGEYSKEFLIDDGDLLIGMDGDFNREIWNGGQALLNQRVCKITANGVDLDQRYLYHFLPKELLRIHASTPAVTVKHLSVKVLRDIDLPLPPLEEQKRIAAILDKADAIRRKRQQAIKLADDFLRSVFLEMFGDPVTNPKGWDVKYLKDISRIQIGPFGTQLHKEDYVSDGVPLINPTHISGGKLFPNNDLTVSPQKHAELPEYHLRFGDIIMGRRGEMGRCAVIEKESVGWLCGTGSLFIRPHNPGVLSEYLFAYLSSDYMKGYLESESLGATMPNLNKGIVGDIKVPLPSSSVMEKYAKIRDQIIRLKLKNLAFSKCEFFESLSQKAFSGK